MTGQGASTVARLGVSMAVAAGAVALTHVAGGTGVRAQAPTFSAGVSAVRVDVLVTERGRPVLGLGTEDFELRDNGVLQHIDQVDHGEVPINVVLALDRSGSVTGPTLARLQSAADVVIEALTPADRIAVVGFTHAVVAATSLTDDVAAARAALRAPWVAGDTSLIDAVVAAQLLVATEAGRSIVIVFSDGHDTQSWLPPEAPLAAARRGNAVVYVVATQRSGRPAWLREVATLSGGRVHTLANVEELGARLAAILAEFRHRYVLSYRPTRVSPGGWHQLTVRVKGRRAVVEARPGYLSGGD